MGKIPVPQNASTSWRVTPSIGRITLPRAGASTQSPEPCAPNQMEQHRLGVVIRRVGCGNFAAGSRDSKMYTGPPCRILQAPSLGLTWVRPTVRGIWYLAQSCRTKSSSRSDSSPEAVVQVGGGELQVQLLPAKIQAPQQRHRVRPAGDGADDPVPLLQKPMLPAKR